MRPIGEPETKVGTRSARCRSDPGSSVLARVLRGGNDTDGLEILRFRPEEDSRKRARFSQPSPGRLRSVRLSVSSATSLDALPAAVIHPYDEFHLPEETSCCQDTSS